MSRRPGHAQRHASRVPDSDVLLELIHERGGKVSARDLARDLGLRGGDKAELKRRLRALNDGRGGRRAPSMALCEVVEIDEDGEVWATTDALPGVAILLLGRGGDAPAKSGDRLLARLDRAEDGSHIGRIFKLLRQKTGSVVGQVSAQGETCWLRPSSRDVKRDIRILDIPSDVKDGDLVRAEIVPNRPLTAPTARITERFGRFDEPGAVSMSVAAELGLRCVFPAEVEDAANRAEPASPAQRADIRHLPLVTIDGADARDFDDAVWAQPDEATNNKGGFRAIVAIADVAHYVSSGSPLDREALARGNSVYFPDRVLPMLPEALSNGLCSLRPDEDRACIACHMRFAANGALLDYRFERAIMKSCARLTYEQVQEARDGHPGPATAPLLETVIKPLYALFDCLVAARKERGTIDLDIAERQVVFADDGTIETIRPRLRMPSHMLIEEMMIAANVAAASALEAKRAPCVFRVHERPDAIKLEALAQYLAEMGLSGSRNPKSQHDFNRVLGSIDDVPLREQVAKQILRAQAQARYSPENLGHYGLNLKRYAHFTSPIRRYADLIVHRLLIERLGLGGFGEQVDESQLDRWCEQISASERVAVDAERKAHARYTALFMADREGAEFTARITSVQRFGLFVELDGIGAEGLIPVSSLGDEWFHVDERAQLLIGDRSRTAYGIGDRAEVVLIESDTAKGMLQFSLLRHASTDVNKAAAKAARNRPGARGRKKGPMRRSRVR